jgi:SAM-dependent methyltransferase
MLTVDFDRLGLRRGDLLLDLGAGGGRHAFEAARCGARVVPIDLDRGDLRAVTAMLAAMGDTGKAPPGAFPGCVEGDAVRLPFGAATFDRVIASEVLEHVVDDHDAMAELARVLKPGGTLAVTVPRWFPERVCWAISDGYHAPKVPGGHVRIYTRSRLLALLQGHGLDPGGWHHTHAFHSPYWWLRCAVGPSRPAEDHPLTRAYHRLLVWDLTRRPALTRMPERILNPVLGKSLVVYAQKVA